MHFMKCILHYTLSQASPEVHLKQASDAMLPMVASEPAAFVSIGQDLLRAQSGAQEDIQQEVLKQIQSMAELATSTGPLNVALKSSFEGLFRGFAADTRSLLHYN